MRAKVIFTDGFHVSPTIETVRENLRERLKRVMLKQGGNQSPALAATFFVGSSLAAKHPTAIHNTPEGRSYGTTISHIMRPEFWPNIDATQAGVFLVHTDSWDVEFWGGKGFEDTPEFTAAIPERESLREEE